MPRYNKIDDFLFLKEYMYAYTHGKTRQYIIDRLGVTENSYIFKLRKLRNRGVIIPRLRPVSAKELSPSATTGKQRLVWREYPNFYDVYTYAINHDWSASRLAKKLNVSDTNLRRMRRVWNLDNPDRPVSKFIGKD